MKIVEKKGFEGLTLQALAEDLDYSVAAVYRYFPSKDALISTLQRCAVVMIDHALRQSEARCERFGPLGPIAANALLYARIGQVSPEVFALVALAVGDPRQMIDEPMAAEVFDRARPLFARLAAHLERASDARAIDRAADPLRRAIGLWGAVHGVVQLRKMQRVAGELLATDPLVDEIVTALLIGWHADRQAVMRLIGEVRSAIETHARLDEELLASAVSELFQAE